jgi:hypothetical protein
LKLFRAVWAWTMGAEWRTWLAHGSVAFLFAFFGGQLGALLAFGGYAGREIGQIEKEVEAGIPVNAKDHIMDAAAPFLALVLAGILRW